MSKNINRYICDKTKNNFIDWLRQNGAEVLAPTNSYELVRFIAHGAVHVIYNGRKGINACGFGLICVQSYQNGVDRIDMGLTKKPRTPLARLKNSLILRDGNNCFFCKQKMSENDISVEHLVSKHKGGCDHMDNLALAHVACNRNADNLPLMEKIKIRERV